LRAERVQDQLEEVPAGGSDGDVVVAERGTADVGVGVAVALVGQRAAGGRGGEKPPEEGLVAGGHGPGGVPQPLDVRRGQRHAGDAGVVPERGVSE